jgi:diacylglycerol kinase family enzyme
VTDAGATTIPAPIGAPAPQGADALLRSGPKARMLLVVNPKATTVSDRLKNLISYALRSRFDLEAVDTEAQNHATELTREALRDGFEVVVAFGGDGTVNEVANGLTGSDVPLTVLPGGSTNVVSRTLGIPADVVDATERLLALPDPMPVRRIDLAYANERCFLSSAGVGLDADTTKWVHEHTPLKSRAGPLFFTYAALMSFYLKYAGRSPRLVVEAAGERFDGVTAIVQNSDPFTFFRSRPVHVCEDAALDNGTLSLVVLRRARQRDAPSLGWKLLSGRGHLSDHSEVLSRSGLPGARIAALGGAGRADPFPLQVDGDYIGDCREVAFAVRPGALAVVA